MWKCYHCSKPIAKNAKVCPHCGGTFNAYSRGFMQSNARMDDTYAREKAGLPPKGCLGAAVGLVAVTVVTLVLTMTMALANDRTGPDVLGLKLGMTLAQVTAQLPEHLAKERPQTRDTTLTFSAAGSAGNVRHNYVFHQAWRHRTQGFEDHLELNVDPAQRVTFLKRWFVYDIYRNPNHTAPLAASVLTSLRDKYGPPQQQSERTPGLVEGKWRWFMPVGAAKGTGANERQFCTAYAVDYSGGSWHDGVGSAAANQQLNERLGGPDTRCGAIVTAEYSIDGDFLRSLTVTIQDAHWNVQVANEIYAWLKAESDRLKAAARDNAGAVPKL